MGRAGCAEFHAARALIGELHDQKQADYGVDGDPFANIRQAVQWGLPASLGACIRIGDKVSRLKTFYAKGELANESVEDAFLDLAVYALIGYCLFREESTTNAVPSTAIVSRARCARCAGIGYFQVAGVTAFCEECSGSGWVGPSGGASE
jgi:hypothetical protein